MTDGVIPPPPYDPYLMNGRIHLTAPSHFCIYNNDRADVLNYLSIIGTFTINENKLLHLDFSQIEHIGAAASVMLFAEITRAQLGTGQSNIITYTLPTAQIAKKRFIKTGLVAAIKQGGKNKIEKLFQSGSIFQSGTDPDKFTLPIMKQLEEYKVGLSRQQKNYSLGVRKKQC